jgi:hypothetical protein
MKKRTCPRCGQEGPYSAVDRRCSTCAQAQRATHTLLRPKAYRLLPATEEEILARSCKICGAKPKQPCRDKETGQPLDDGWHAARIPSVPLERN